MVYKPTIYDNKKNKRLCPRCGKEADVVVDKKIMRCRNCLFVFGVMAGEE